MSVSKEKFFRFLNTRDKGTYNVFDPRFREDANLTKDETIFIIRNFSELDQQHNNKASILNYFNSK
jgi:hypothetical protein